MLGRNYSCTHLCVKCIDFRFQEALHQWMRAQNLLNDCDVVGLAGAQRAFKEGEEYRQQLASFAATMKRHGINGEVKAGFEQLQNNFGQGVAMKQLELAIALHGVSSVVLISHQDCGTYGGSKAFASWEEERSRYLSDLRSAEKIIREKYSQIRVRKVIFTFNDNGIDFSEVA